MEAFFARVMVGIALEALVQLLKNAWDADLRSSWSYTRIAVVVIPVIAAFMTKPDINYAGLAFDQPLLSYLISGLVVGRIAQWVHDIYKKTA
jgi:hypothetical protein